MPPGMGGCRLAILSNELDLFYGADFQHRLPLVDLFDVIVDATYTQVLKPDARAYAACQAQLGVAAIDCVFVDDQQRNVDGATRAGWRTVHLDVRRPGDAFGRALDLLGVARPEGLPTAGP
jgi:putative hydrolase of the HAD superfamily